MGYGGRPGRARSPHTSVFRATTIEKAQNNTSEAPSVSFVPFVICDRQLTQIPLNYLLISLFSGRMR
jgi:hypothetical protein